MVQIYNAAMAKSTPHEIAARFDREVERFSNLETGQSATIDAPLVLDLITSSAAAVNPRARSVLDVGCGAGNYTIKLLQKIPRFDSTLVDLSSEMLLRAVERVGGAGAASMSWMQGDIRALPLPKGEFDIILAAAVLHHLRTDAEWESVFAKLFDSLRPGGSIWISDLVEHAHAAVHQLMWNRYGEYLTGLKDEHYRDQVFTYVDAEDTPRSLPYQLDLLKRVGFGQIEILHKNGPFAAFGAVKNG